MAPYTFGGAGSDEIQAGIIQSETNSIVIEPGVSNRVITGNRYLAHDITVNGVGGLIPENIKKGMIVGGIMGTWEVYVVGPNDLYYKGVNPYGWYDFQPSTVKFENEQITPRVKGNWIHIVTNIHVKLSGYNQLVMQGKFASYAGKPNCRLWRLDTGALIDGKDIELKSTTVVFNITGAQVATKIKINVSMNQITGDKISRIYLA